MATKRTSFLVWTTAVPAAAMAALCIVGIVVNGEVPWQPVAALAAITAIHFMSQSFLNFGEKVYCRRMYRKIFDDYDISNSDIDVEIELARSRVKKWGG